MIKADPSLKKLSVICGVQSAQLKHYGWLIGHFLGRPGNGQEKCERRICFGVDLNRFQIPRNPALE